MKMAAIYFAILMFCITTWYFIISWAVNNGN
jgi:hypothetical protein